ncbi:endonuclease/exonuclease/phosphatase family protein [Paeniglutamicibacter sp. MACA_103]|uniref:endonuclease/exonuclease/phosphatase family protein n=1 Tax=Paeniglutamicibacter sp. MACA_103 TaxID=3377337 RepID=UPI003894F4D7
MARDWTAESSDLRAPLSRRLLAVSVPGAFLAVLPHLSIGSSAILAVLQALLPLLFLAALGMCAVLACRRSFIPAVVLLVLAAASVVPVLAPSAGTTCSPGAPLTVVSLNAGRGHADASSLAAVIGESDPAILVLVETSEPLLKALAAESLDWAYTHRTGEVFTGGSVDTVFLSRYPLREEAPAVLQSQGALFDAPVAVIEHPEAGRIRVAGIHPAPPTYAPSSWASSLYRLAAWKEEHAGMPLVLAGDFNATTAHPHFRTLAAGLAEASPAWGPWAAGTWPADSAIPAFAAIDHVLVRGLAVRDAERFSVPGTDHHGIVAQLSSCR